MIHLKVGEKKVGLPNDWTELTVDKYAQIVDILC